MDVLALFLPVVLLGALFGLERLERWTTARPAPAADRRTAGSAATTAAAATSAAAPSRTLDLRGLPVEPAPLAEPV